MKKIMIAFISLFTALCIAGCAGSGNVDNVMTEPIQSKIYSQKDYEQAVNVALSYFSRNFGDCTMTDIRYAGDDMEDSMKEWEKDYGMDQVIILTSDFKTGKHCDKSFDPDSNYTDWQWILARNKGGKWKHKDHGYG